MEFKNFSILTLKTVIFLLIWFVRQKRGDIWCFKYQYLPGNQDQNGKIEYDVVYSKRFKTIKPGVKPTGSVKLRVTTKERMQLHKSLRQSKQESTVDYQLLLRFYHFLPYINLEQFFTTI